MHMNNNIYENIIEVIKPGFFSTIQDIGRFGYQQYGVSVSGAMDLYAFKIANILVGNRKDYPCVEIYQSGAIFRFLENTVIAICGADSTPLLDGEPIDLWKSYSVRKGQTLHFSNLKSGLYTYLAVYGGTFIHPPLLGSYSTYTKAKMSNSQVLLKKGDKLKAKMLNSLGYNRRLPNSFIPNYFTKSRIRVHLGPDFHRFQEESIIRFLSETYYVSNKIDRMGYRLEGPKLKHKTSADLLSEAIMPGTIQVPLNGQPIILLADRQTTGGYTRIATVTAIDLPYVVQKQPGEKISFQSISLKTARQLYIEQERIFQILNSTRIEV